MELTNFSLLKPSTTNFLSQLNNTPTRGNNILDLVITNAPDNISLQDILSPGESAILTDHHSISFDFTAFHKAPRKFVRNVYDYAKGDFEGLCGALRAEGLTSTISDSGEVINTCTDWSVGKRSFLQLSLTLYLRRNLMGEIHFFRLVLTSFTKLRRNRRSGER